MKEKKKRLLQGSDSGAFADWVANSSNTSAAAIGDLSLGFNVAGGGGGTGTTTTAGGVVGGHSGMWSASRQMQINYGLQPTEMGMFVVHPASFQHHHQHHENTINFDPHGNNNSNLSNTCTTNTSLGVGVIPLLTATPLTNMVTFDDQDLVTRNNRGGNNDASRRRERQLLGGATTTNVNVVAAGSSSQSTSSAKKPRLVNSQTTTTASHTSTSNNTPPRSFDTSSSHQDASFKGSLPGQVRAPAVFKCVRVTSVDEGEDEYAYQAVVKIGGHLFKGFLYDQGLDEPKDNNNNNNFPNLSDLHLGAAATNEHNSHLYAASTSGGLLGGGSNYGNQIN
ncbi:hypothetical protein KY285_008209 [Solanum tuberosum]|nr:hypothetical protein KY285_008209 [Solanum tuberosum]